MLKRVLAGLVLVVIFLAASWSLLQPGFFRVHDYVHGVRIAEMARSVGEGQFPVRWTANFGYGFGMPLYEFYAPLPFYVGAAFYMMGFDLISSVRALFLICSLMTLLGSYQLGRVLYGRAGGLVTAAALTLAPYRAVNLFVRGALSEAWGIMALPWILLGIVLVIKESSQSSGERSNEQSKVFSVPGWVVLMGGLVTLFLSHNLTTMMFLPFSILFALVYSGLEVARFSTALLAKKQGATDWWRDFDWKKMGAVLARLAGCYCLAIGVSAFYIFPAFAEKDLTQIHTILGGYFHYANHFLYARQFFSPNWGYGGSGWGPEDGFSFFLGYGQLLSLLIAGGLLLKLVGDLFHEHQKGGLARIWQQVLLSRKIVLGGTLGVILVGSLFFSLFKSKPIWDAVTFMEFIQFPWRFLSVAIVALALMSGLSVTLVNGAIRRYALTGLFLVIIIVGNALYFRPENWLEDPTTLYYDNPHQVRVHMSDILKDYVPKQMSLDSEILKQQYVEAIETQKSQLNDLNLGKVLIDRGHEKLYSVSPAEELTLDIPIAYFPGWTAELDGQPHSLNVSKLGTIQVVVPKGAHLVGVRFSSTPIRWWSDALSAVSIFAVLMLGLNRQTLQKFKDTVPGFGDSKTTKEPKKVS